MTKPSNRIKSSILHVESGVQLTEREAKFVEAKRRGASDREAEREAGYAIQTRPILKGKNLVTALTVEQELARQAAQVTREDVVNGIKEAIEQAKLLSDPQAQIAGWRELAKVCGLNAPEVKKVEVTHTGGKMLSKLAAMSDDELLRLANATVVEGEVVDDDEPA